MRVVGEIPHPDCKITLFHWNNRYLIKLEQGYLEQTFKIDQFDIPDEQALTRMVDQDFIQKAIGRFSDMAGSLHEALQKA